MNTFNIIAICWVTLYVVHMIIVELYKDEGADSTMFLLLNWIPLTWIILDLALIAVWVQGRERCSR